MKFDITHDGRTTLATDYAGAVELGYPAAVIGSALKARAAVLIGVVADDYRAKVSTMAPGKIAEWLFKEQIARAPESARAEELAILDREANARGLDRDGMLTLIIVKANAFREIALLIGAIEAEGKMAVAAVPDDAADIEDQVGTALAEAQTEAAEAFATALSLINGQAEGD